MMTQQEYIASHPITLKLKSFGLSQKQLESVRFNRPSNDISFAKWPLTWNGSVPEAAFPHLRAFCALKWFLDSAPGSLHREDAEIYASNAMVADWTDRGFTFSRSQSKRAQKPRAAFSGGVTPKQLIMDFAGRPENREKGTKTLWMPFIEELRTFASDVFVSQDSDIRRWRCEYRYKKRTRSLSFRYFSNIVSERKD